jgi:hypothetical protein
VAEDWFILCSVEDLERLRKTIANKFNLCESEDDKAKYKAYLSSCNRILLTKRKAAKKVL